MKPDSEQSSSMQINSLSGFKQPSLQVINSKDKLWGLEMWVGDGDQALTPMCFPARRALLACSYPSQLKLCPSSPKILEPGIHLSLLGCRDFTGVTPWRCWRGHESLYLCPHVCSFRVQGMGSSRTTRPFTAAASFCSGGRKTGITSQLTAHLFLPVPLH